MKNPERALAMLIGEVHALFMFCQMMAKEHPDREQMLSDIEQIHNSGIASLGPSPVPEATIDGFEYVIEALRNIVLAQPAKK